jgi:hypothetical protein
MYRINFYVPETHLEIVKDALFQAGAGKIGHYDHCCWQTKGTGQFRPLDSSSPHIGKKNKLHQEEEYRVEIACADDLIQQVLQSLVDVHPYEEPAYEAYSILTIHDA